MQRILGVHDAKIEPKKREGNDKLGMFIQRQNSQQFLKTLDRLMFQLQEALMANGCVNIL